jgi:hypothetical protein
MSGRGDELAIFAVRDFVLAERKIFGDAHFAHRPFVALGLAAVEAHEKFAAFDGEHRRTVGAVAKFFGGRLGARSGAAGGQTS